MKIEQSGLQIIVHQKCPWCGSSTLKTLYDAGDRSGSGVKFPIVKCDDCQFVFTQNAPIPEAIAPFYEFEEYISHSDSQSSITDKAYHWVRSRMFKKKERIIRKHGPGKRPGRILDYGSGTGYFLHHMLKTGWQATGVEINESARSYSIDKFGLNVSQPNDFDRIAGPFEVITLWHVLEHLYDFKEKLNAFHTLLVPNGILVLALPNLQSYDARRLKKDWAALDAPRHLWHFTPGVIKQIAEHYGFNYEKVYPMPYDAFYVSILSYQLRQDNFLALLKGGITGLLSNLSCTFNSEEASSVIYILRKK